MQKTTYKYATIYFPKKVHDLLRKESFKTKISISKIISSAVLKYLGKDEKMEAKTH